MCLYAGVATRSQHIIMAFACKSVSTLSRFQCLIRPNVCNLVLRNAHNGIQETRITLTDDGSTIVCLHSKPSFPYEHSRPLPEPTDEIASRDSMLKLEHRLEAENFPHRPDGPDMEELQLLTFTPSLHWAKFWNPKKRVPLAPKTRPGI